MFLPLYFLLVLTSVSAQNDPTYPFLTNSPNSNNRFNSCKNVLTRCENLKEYCLDSYSLSNLYCRETCGKCTSSSNQKPELKCDSNNSNSENNKQSKSLTPSYTNNYCCDAGDAMENYCGNTILTDRSKRSKRLVSSENDSIIERWPWAVFIEVPGLDGNSNKKSKICIGGLIDEFHFVTLASCFDDMEKEDEDATSKIIIKIGQSQQKSLKISKITTHADYKFPNYNIAVVKLTNKISRSKFSSPICLPAGNDPKIDDVCVNISYDEKNKILVESDQMISVCSDKFIKVMSNQTITTSTTTSSRDRPQKLEPTLTTCASIKKFFTNLEKTITIPKYGQEQDPKTKNFLKNLNKSKTSSLLVCQRKCSCSWYIHGIGNGEFSRDLGGHKMGGIYNDLTGFQPWILEVMESRLKEGNCNGCRDLKPPSKTLINLVAGGENNVHKESDKDFVHFFLFYRRNKQRKAISNTYTYIFFSSRPAHNIDNFCLSLKKSSK